MVDLPSGATWDDVEKEQSRDYIGEVLVSELREVSPEEYSEWSSPPKDGVTPIELYLAIKPLDKQLTRLNHNKEEVDYFEYRLVITQADGRMKRANSGVGLFRAACRKLGFPDPTTTVGRVFAVSELTKDYGGGIMGRVVLFTQFMRDGYAYQGELPTWDFRPKDRENMPDAEPSAVPAGQVVLAAATATALAVALDGVPISDTVAINNAVRRCGQTAAVRTLQLNNTLFDTLTAMGVVSVEDGTVHALVGQPV